MSKCFFSHETSKGPSLATLITMLLRNPQDSTTKRNSLEILHYVLLHFHLRAFHLLVTEQHLVLSRVYFV